MTDKKFFLAITIYDFLLVQLAVLLIMTIAGPFENPVQRFLAIALPLGVLIAWRGYVQARRLQAALLARKKNFSKIWTRLPLECFILVFLLVFVLMMIQAGQVALAQDASIADTAKMWGLGGWIKYAAISALFSFGMAIAGALLGIFISAANYYLFQKLLPQLK